jgi:hypothetical protein
MEVGLPEAITLFPMPAGHLEAEIRVYPEKTLLAAVGGQYQERQINLVAGARYMTYLIIVPLIEEAA